MKQLSAMDAGFLYLENGRSFGHVNGLCIFERPDDPDFNAYEAYKQQLLGRMSVLEPFRRRLVEVPLGLDHPYWVNDPDFDIDFHVRHIAVPAPGGAEQLAELVARLIGRQMDRSRPLWEVYVIEGLESGDFAVLSKTHHATIDGASGAEMMMMVLDPDPSVHDPTDDEGWLPDRLPSNSELLARTAVAMARQPIKAVRVQVRLLRALANITQNDGFNVLANQIRAGIPGPAGDLVGKLLRADEVEQQDHAPPPPRITAPKTPFNASITAHRRFAHRSASLNDIKAIKNALGATINDVVMAICAGGLRRYLLEHDALPDQDLRAMVPVSIRTGEEEEKWTNRVSAIFSDIPTSVEDPLERVAAVNAAMTTAKQQFDLMPADMIGDLSALAPPALAARASRLATRVGLADRTNPPVNLVISNVPGPREPLAMQSGAVLKHYYPVSTVVDGQGLNITVQSYVGVLDFGLVACRELVPDLWTLMDHLFDEIDALAAAAGVTLEADAAKKKPPAKKAAEMASTGKAKRGSTKKTTPKKSSSGKATSKKAAAK